MSYAVWLVPVGLAMGLVGLVAFLWSMKSGQLEDLDGAAERVLLAEKADRPLPSQKAVRDLPSQKAGRGLPSDVENGEHRSSGSKGEHHGPLR